MRILLVEDEPRVVRFIKRGLNEERHDVDIASDAAEALALAHVGQYDVIVLDVMLPGQSGFHVASRLRSEGNTTPILMLTALDTPRDVAHGLDVGADDYLTKPFDFVVLLARLRALSRRKTSIVEDVLRFQDITLDRLRHTVHRSESRIQLTPTEFKLLEALMRRPGEVVRRSELMDSVLGKSFDPGTGLLDVHMANLRSKLEAGGRPRVITTVRGIGFSLAAPGRE
ncbi:MAG: response regulator transcription factor [Gemmatimonadota bacterium]|nr:MAG: response regulator transcription factor [Gemmatimonadota bacterium]